MGTSHSQVQTSSSRFTPHSPIMVKAVVLGAAGGIGQPLSLLCKISPLIDELSLFDVVNTPGVAADLSHISSVATVGGFVAAKGDFKGEKQETEDAKKEALTGADIVIIPAGVPRKPGQLHRPNRRRSVEGGWLLRSQETLRCYDP